MTVERGKQMGNAQWMTKLRKKVQVTALLKKLMTAVSCKRNVQNANHLDVMHVNNKRHNVLDVNTHAMDKIINGQQQDIPKVVVAKANDAKRVAVLG